MLFQVIIAQSCCTASCCMNSKTQSVQNKSSDISFHVKSYCNYAIIAEWQMLNCNGITVFFVFLCGFVVNALQILHFLWYCVNKLFCFAYSTKTNQQTIVFLSSQEYFGFLFQDKKGQNKHPKENIGSKNLISTSDISLFFKRYT